MIRLYADSTDSRLPKCPLNGKIVAGGSDLQSSRRNRAE